MVRDDVATRFLRWGWMRSVGLRGYLLVTRLCGVIDADLSAFRSRTGGDTGATLVGTSP